MGEVRKIAQDKKYDDATIEELQREWDMQRAFNKLLEPGSAFMRLVAEAQARINQREAEAQV